MRRMGWIFAVCAAALLAQVAGAAGENNSWGQINQELARPEGWTRIVQNSAFPLGELEQIGQAEGQPLYELNYGMYPSIDGSTVAVPMVMEFARQHLPLTETDLQSFVFLSTTHPSYEHLIGRQPNGSPLVPSLAAAMDEKHPVDLLIATEPSQDELAMAETAGVTLAKKPVCYDAFVFITNTDNPVHSLSVEQLRQIYTGEITNWQEVGGLDAPIIPYQRSANSGSQTAMENLVMGGQPLSASPRNYVTDSMSGLVERVGDFDSGIHSLGYTYRFYIDTLYKNDHIKAIAIDGVEPTNENLRNGAYPFTTYYYGVIRAGEEDGPGGRFLEWMLSQEGQRSIEQAGYIPMEAIP